MTKKNKEYEVEEVMCMICEKTYRRDEEPLEVAEGGERICPECWAEMPCLVYGEGEKEK